MEILKIENISKIYKEHTIFKDFNLNVNKGEFIAIMGKSGKGKSTLLNLIGGLECPTSGSILIADIKNPYKSQTLVLRSIVSYLFQNYALIDNKTVSENLDIALEYVKEKKKDKLSLKIQALEKVNLANKINSKVYKLSGGEQQRVALARLFLKPSKIILADEPTGALDIINRDIVLNLLHELNKLGKTIIVVTHDPYIGEQSDRVIYL